MHRFLWLVPALLLSVPVHAEIYRWVDDQGRVHFGERPQQGAERIEVNPQVIERDASVRQSEEAMRRLMEVRREERSAEQAAQAQRLAQQREACERMGRELARYDSRVFWYETDASGKKVEVDRSRVQQRRSELETQIQERC
ncbi:MAG: DUF4124 domain-containing protein [Gammaproteobacteria bacterium HGW-Gammaproteobacteria-11]|nr:MAG: DUF4124 domain-containing protein [Gammaproteobacteria bacterium HGW-Gammaproteobacteria-11]